MPTPVSVDLAKSTGAVPEEVRAELDRILASPEFTTNERRRRFLRYVVEETLAGRSTGIKGPTIAVAVFNRDASFDPQLDPVVRIEARHLRRDLDSYYMAAGAANPMRIIIPKGGYIPIFQKRSDLIQPAVGMLPPAKSLVPEPSFARPVARISGIRDYLLIGIAAGLLLLIVTTGIVFLQSASTGTSAAALAGSTRLVVMPLQALDNSQLSNSLSTGLDSDLVNDLRRFHGIKLYQPQDGSNAQEAIARLNGPEGPVYVLKGDVLSDSERINISVQLASAASGELIWSESIVVPANTAKIMNVRRDIAGKIATVLGQPYGPLNEDVVRREATAAAASLDSYLCVLQAYHYRRAFDEAEFGQTRKCLEAAILRDPRYADAWAMLGWLYLDDGRYGFTGGDQSTLYANAAVTAGRALQLEPENTLALKAMSSILYYRAQYDEAERLARKAVALNPYDPDALAQLGWRLAARENFAEGIPFLREAIARSANPPGWYYHLIAIDQYLRGDYQDMYRTAFTATKDGSEFSQALLALAAVELHQMSDAMKAAESIQGDSMLRVSPEAFLQRHGGTDMIVKKVSDGLRAMFAKTDSKILGQSN